MKLRTTLLQKLAAYEIYEMDDGMDQSTLHCCYGEYVTTNQQT